MSRAEECCPLAGSPLGLTKWEWLIPSCSALAFILRAKASTLPALSRARARATSFMLLTSRILKRSPRR